MRREAESIFREALRAVEVRAAVAGAIRWEQERLWVGNTAVETAGLKRLVMLAVGKAGAAMAEAAVEALGAGRGLAIEALVVAPEEPKGLNGRTMFFRGAHPTPNEDSRRAAVAAVEMLRTADEGTLVLFLISGGASSMLEMPLDAAITVAETGEFHRALVQSGLSIGEMNAVRKHFSAVKGGRLAVAAGRAAAQRSLIVSDVPEGRLEVVGSGVSMPDSSTCGEVREILERLGAGLPKTLRRFFARPLFQETPKASDAVFARCAWTEILSSRHLAEAAKRAAEARGFYVEIDSGCDEWEYRLAGRYLLDRSAVLAQEHGRCCLISVGEVAVRIDGACGVGGRNQQMALWCALELDQRGEAVTVLSAGSDGIDGNSGAAGAVVDEGTVGRARGMGLDMDGALAGFDASPLFARMGDAVVTGATGNNLRDLRILIRG